MKPDQDVSRATIPEPMTLPIFAPCNRPRHKTATASEDLVGFGGCRGAKPINYSQTQREKRLLSMSHGQYRASMAENRMADMLAIRPRAPRTTKGTGDGGPGPHESNNRETNQQIEDFERV